jgi:hypothetical protein
VATTTRTGISIERVDRTRWLELSAGFADHNYRQTWDFGVLAAARVGAVSEHVAIRADERVLALADVRIKRVPLLGGIAYVTGGPLTRSDGVCDVKRCLDAVTALRDEYALRRGFVLRVVPPIGPAGWNQEVAAGLAQAGFAKTEAAPIYRTMLVDISGPPAAIRKSFHQKWRNCLNRAEKERLTVRAGGAEDLDRFAAMFDEFVVRKGFDVQLGVDFYRSAQRDLPESERFLLLLAERDGALLAGHLSSALGDTMVYLLGATTPQALTCKAAYLLQWQAIEHARSRGCRWYDLGGIDPEGNPGVFHFKEGLGGADVTAAGPVEWNSGLRPRLVRVVESGYRRMRARRGSRAGKA